MDRAIFGPAGSSEAFSQKYKSSLMAPAYLEAFGLDCFEYQCGRGVNIGRESAEKLGEEAKKHNIKMSLHSPYFINLSGDGERVEKNIGYILASARACDLMGGDRVVVHCGGLSGRTRQEAMKNTLFNLGAALDALDGEGLGHITLCVETMGKINVLGDFDEITEICRRYERLLPCIDFGHLNCRTGGAVNSYEAFGALLSAMENRLGRERAESFHAHFSKIEYSKGGEVRHLTFEDDKYGPDFDPLGRLLAERGFTPRVICESAGTQDADALTMKNIYLNYLKEE